VLWFSVGGLDLPERPIESTFPITHINAIAERESTGFGRRHYRSVYTMHKWWARRLGSVFRAIMLYSLADTSVKDWNQDPDSLWELYIRDVDFSGKVVLDPMMGGGTTLIEALRFRCSVIGGDLNPVAWFVVKKQIEDIDPELLRQSLTTLDEELGDELRKYYWTTCPECGQDAEAIYYFHRKEVACPDCGNNIPLMHSFFLAKSPTGDGDLVVCPQCWEIFLTKNAKKEEECPKCGEIFTAVNNIRTKKRWVSCSESGKSHRIIDLITNKGRAREHLYAVEFYCRHCDLANNPHLKHGRGYKTADLRDHDLLREAEAEFEQIGHNLPIPDIEIPSGIETKRALNHGYERFRDMFSARQLLTLGKILRWIIDISDWNVKEFMTLAFSNCLKYNNMFAKYNSTRGFITDIFRTHSFSPSMAPVETNCYDTAKGRGAFTAFVNLVIEGKEYCRAPFERFYEDGKMEKISEMEPISGKIIQNYTKMTENQSVLLLCGSSEQLRIPDNSVDLVVTDPPYYGNVMYSELSNFFYVWLRIVLQNRYDHFSQTLVPWREEVIENRAQNKGKAEFIEGLTKILTETSRVLKDDGLLVFTFHHRKAEAWEALLQAVLASGFFIKAIHPVRSEMRASTHLYDMENIVYDVILVCRKRGGEHKSVSWQSVKDDITETTLTAIAHLVESGESLGRLDAYVVGLGKCLEHYSKHYPDVCQDGKRIEIGEALTSISTILNEKLEKLLKKSDSLWR
jgi:putative DNA methylase